MEEENKKILIYAAQGLTYQQISDKLLEDNMEISSEAVRFRVRRFRKKLGTDDRVELLKRSCEDAGIPLEDVSHYWYKNEMFSIFAKNKVVTYDEIRKDQILVKFSSCITKESYHGYGC